MSLAAVKTMSSSVTNTSSVRTASRAALRPVVTPLLKGRAMTSMPSPSADTGSRESSATTIRPSKTVRALARHRRSTSGRSNVLTVIVTRRATSARSSSVARPKCEASTRRTTAICARSAR